MASWRLETSWLQSELVVHSDKISLPESALKVLSGIPAATFPLNIDIRCPSRGTKAFAGVKDFTAPDESAVLPGTKRQANS